MLIQINTDRNIEGSQEREKNYQDILNDELARFRQQITRIEVHLSDEDSDKKVSDGDMRCLVEARLTGLRPISVSDQAATIDQAFHGAIDKLKAALESTLGRLEKR